MFRILYEGYEGGDMSGLANYKTKDDKNVSFNIWKCMFAYMYMET